MEQKFEEQQKQGPLAALTGFAAGGGGGGSGGGQDRSEAAKALTGAQGFDMAAWMAGHNPSSKTRGGGAADNDGAGDPSKSGPGGGNASGSSSTEGKKARRRG